MFDWSDAVCNSRVYLVFGGIVVCFVDLAAVVYS